MSQSILTRCLTVWRCQTFLLLVALFSVAEQQRTANAADASQYFGIHLVDEVTGRGVPLVELETVNHLRWVTDSAGWVAVNELGLMGRQVFFFVRSHGYEYPKDKFGYSGIRLRVSAGERAEVTLKRSNVAERLYRITGEGIYRDSVLLGEAAPLARPLGSGMVAGQDSVSAVLYRDRIFWFWGDTSRMRYPLGHFWMACAQSLLPEHGGLEPASGVDLEYFTDEEGFSRPVARLGVEQGVVWADGFFTLPDQSGKVRLVCHYAHMQSLQKMLGHGLAVYDDKVEKFELLKRLDMKDRYLFPGQAHPVRYGESNSDYVYFGEVFPNVRVRANWESYLDPRRYEVFTCLAGSEPSSDQEMLLDDQGRVTYQWKRGGYPINGQTEQKLISDGRLTAEQAHFLPADVDSGKPILMHRGSVHWNPYRKRWIMIATQTMGTSMLGETWYSEADALTGPWRKAKKIVTHDKYSFYNPVHHPFFDQRNGRLIFFEGTYTRTFSGNPIATPRYDYNQIMYRLDLSDPNLDIVKNP